jgi:uncharacterized protein (PEP-CTERM system associated)
LACSLVIAFGFYPLTAAAGDWTITERAAGQEIYTDNVFLTPTNTKSDFITTLAPAISVNGTSARLFGTLSYAPALYAYANTSSLDAVEQNLFANGTGILVPSHLFLDAWGSASELPTAPGLAPFGTGPTVSPAGPNFFGTGSALSPSLPTTALTLTTSFSGSPYVQQRFDDYGVAQLRYTITSTGFGGRQTTPIAPAGFVPASGTTLTNEGTATFLTGDFFGPLKSRLTFDSQESTGAGVLNHSGQIIALLDSAYAIDRRLAALATIGYENIRYETSPLVHIADAVWGFGALLTPNPTSAITLRYGRQSGITGFYLDGHFAVTAHTTLYATYVEGLSTPVTSLEQSLALATLNPQGQPVNSLTGFPLPIPIGSSFTGQQNALTRNTQAQVLGSLSLERNQFSLAVYRFESSVVATSVSGTGVSQNSTQGSAYWTRNITPLLTGTVSLSVGRLTFPGSIPSSEGLLTAGGSVSYGLPHQMTAWASYYFYDRTSPDSFFQATSNTVLVGLSKQF